MKPSDVWGAAAPPPDATRREQLIAYVDSTSVGFDLRLPLPPVCMRCAARDDISPLTLKLKVQGDLVARAAAFAKGGRAAFGGVVRPGDKIDLVLPLCAACHARRKRERNLALAVALGPVWIIALAIAAGHVGGVVAAVVILGALALFVALGILLFVKRTSALKLERVDGDGIIRLGNVHHDAGQAIVEAAATT